MMQRFLSIKNFEKYQHYKDRNPPWVKWYWDVLSDDKFVMLPMAERGLYSHLILLASRHNNEIPYDLRYIQLQLKLHTKPNLDRLIHDGFLLAQCYQESSTTLDPSDSPSTERELEKELERETEKSNVGQGPDHAHPVNGTAMWTEAEALVTFLNQRTGKQFQARTPAGAHTKTLKLIHNLLKQNYSPVQIRQVIANRWLRWGTDPKMQEYLRPSTLFRPSNFENYLGELGVQS